MKNTKNAHEIVSENEWLKARRKLLAEEKKLTKLNDEVSRKRRELPWVRVDKEYVFEGPDGRKTLADLFANNSQLIVYHFMFAPGWTEGCVGCSFLADHIDAANLHLAHHDVSLVAVSLAPWREFEPFKKRMGWRFTWVSSHGSDFNFDYHVSPTKEDAARKKHVYNFADQEGPGGERPGISVFCKEGRNIYHTYSAYARGGDILIGAHNYLDLTPKGRNEENIMNWVKHHDKYAEAAGHSCCSRETAS